MMSKKTKNASRGEPKNCIVCLNVVDRTVAYRNITTYWAGPSDCLQSFSFWLGAEGAAE